MDAGPRNQQEQRGMTGRQFRIATVINVLFWIILVIIVAVAAGK